MRLAPSDLPERDIFSRQYKDLSCFSMAFEMGIDPSCVGDGPAAVETSTV